MRRFHQLALASCATLLATAAAFAQNAGNIPTDIPADIPWRNPLTDATRAPKLPNNAAAAALFKDVKTMGEAAPDPKRPAGGNTNTPHPITNFVPVTDAMLRDPDPANWMMIRGNYEGYGFSKLDQINRGNVKSLQLVWSRVMEPGPNQGAPVVYNGIMFVPNANDVIQALDASTGELLWQYRRRLPTAQQMHNQHWGDTKRGIAIYDDKIYLISRDNFVVALDAKTGKEVWQVNRGGDLYATNTTGPIVVNGLVLAGSVCQEAPFGCWVDAHDAKTGALIWRNEVIPHVGDPGDATWKGKPFNERWITDVWGPLTYDKESDTLYYGSSGIGPASSAQRQQIGASLAGTNTRFAVNPHTGKILWQHQVLPEDNWDQDCTFEMMPVTTPVHPDAKAEGMFSVGVKVDSPSRKTLIGMPCKTGVVWSFDAQKGTYLWSKSTVPQNLISKVDQKGLVTINQDLVLKDINKTYLQCPSVGGGRDVPMTAYSPQTNVLYAPLRNVCSYAKVAADNIPSMPNNQYNTLITRQRAPGRANAGRIDAISAETGKTLWSWETLVSNYSPILATGGGLLFNGAIDRYLRVHDQTDGKVLWQTRLPSQVGAATVTFSIKGRQYISVGAGGTNVNGGEAYINPGVDQVTGSNAVYVFALPE